MTETNPPPSPSEPTPQTSGESIPPGGAVPPPPGIVYAGPPASKGPVYTGPPPTKDDTTMAMLCHLLGIFTGFLGPLIIWLIKKDSSPFVDDQGKEALNFQIVCLIAVPVCFLGFCLAPILIIALQIFRIVFSIIGTMQSNKGIPYRYPLTLRLIK
jgi:uncharacterized Tic20 family protein